MITFTTQKESIHKVLGVLQVNGIIITIIETSEPIPPKTVQRGEFSKEEEFM